METPTRDAPNERAWTERRFAVLAHRVSQRTVSALTYWVGAGVLVSTWVTSWYTVESSQTAPYPICTRVAESFSPFVVSAYGAGTGCPSNEFGAYGAAGLPVTGEIYLTVAIVVGVAACAALLAGLLSVTARGQARSRWLTVLFLIALVGAAVGPVLIAVEQPGAVCADQGYASPPTGPQWRTLGLPSNQSSGSSPPCNHWSFWLGNGAGWTWAGGQGPWNSFYGSANSNGVTFQWAPDLGWYLAILGTALVGSARVLSRSSGDGA